MIVEKNWCIADQFNRFEKRIEELQTENGKLKQLYSSCVNSQQVNIIQRKHVKDVQQLEAAEKNIQQLQNDQLSCHANQMQLESEVAKLK